MDCVHSSRPLELAQDPPPPGTWRCLVCQKPTNRIHVLPCQHKFCMPCLELWAGIYVDMYHGVDDQFPCQICWKLYNVPEGGIGAYMQDFQVNALENCLQQMTFGQQGEGHGPGPFGGPPGQWDAGTTAEAVFAQQNQGAISPAKLQANVPFPSGHNADINVDDEGCVMMDASDPNAAPGGASEHAVTGNAMGLSPGGVVSPSMVSHMAPGPIRPTHDNNFCLRSHHLYMHMV